MAIKIYQVDRLLLGLFYFTTSVIMGNRWLFFLLGIILVKGSISYSPIPVPDDEWVEFTRMLRDPAYRLPTTTKPRLYEVSLTPYFDVIPPGITGVQPFTFDGDVTIYISATEANVNQVIIHCNDLTILSLSIGYLSGTTFTDITSPGQTFTCEMPYSFLRIFTSTPLLLNQEYLIRSTFRGNLQENMRGFYRSWYVDSSGNKRWMGTTQFQPGHARQAFPCYDEPSFKAHFIITMNREPDFSPTISNMPIRESQNIGTTRVSETFHQTPYTSSYLVAFIVSHYQPVSVGSNVQRPFNIYARDNIGNHGDYSLEIGEKLLTAMEEYTQIPYYDMAPYLNMKQAAIPDFSAGAMENWGLLTYREALILYDPENTNHFYKQRIANIVSHEVTHMWFGNLVTCAWWDNLWLNEGFARFYQYFLTGWVDPELGFETRFIVEQVQVSMSSDSVDTAHALTDPNVNDPATVSAHFSTITYAKGASILRMTQYFLGVDTYVAGLRRYLQERSFDVAEPHHLFNALDAAAVQTGALSAYPGITIDAYFRTWSEKAGHPLLTVSVDQRTGRMTVVQERWEINTGVSQFPSLWHIPITWTRGGAPDFMDLKPSQVMTLQTIEIDRGTSGANEWVIFNKQESGFYRVNYDATNWALITRALRSSERTVIHELNRAQIVDDLFQLARANVLPYQRAFNVLSFLENEDAYAPWIAAINGFAFVIRRLAHDSTNLQRLNNMIIGLSTTVVSRLGFAEVAGGTYMTDLQRLHVMEFLCNVGHEQCVAAGRQNFQNWRNGQFIPANLRPWVYCTGLRHGTADDFNFFWSRYLAEDLANEKVVMLGAAGCTTDQDSLERFLSAIASGNDDIRAQDHSTALSSAITSNEVNTMRVFTWLTNNMAQMTQTLGSLTTPVNTITTRLLDESQITQVQTWLDANREVLGTAYDIGIRGIATSRANLLWSERRLPELTSYFDTGYVEYPVEDINDDTTTTETPTTAAPTTAAPTTEAPTTAAPTTAAPTTAAPTTAAPTTEGPTTTEGSSTPDPTTTPEPEPDSAHVSVLSLATLLITLAINMAA